MDVFGNKKNASSSNYKPSQVLYLIEGNLGSPTKYGNTNEYASENVI